MRKIYFFALFFTINSNAIAGQYAEADSSAYTLNVCNLAPYPLFVRTATRNRNLNFSFDSYEFQAGECNALRRSGSSYDPPLIYLHAEPKNDPAIVYLRTQKWYSDAWNEIGSQQEYGGEGGLYFCVSRSDRKLHRNVQSPYECEKNEEIRSYSAPILFDNSKTASWIVSDFAICRQLRSGGCESRSLSASVHWARDVNQMLPRLAPLPNRPESIIPTDLGVSLTDTNGPFEQGLTVQTAVPETPFGTPVGLRPGDEILSFGGIPVYGYDIVALIYRAAKKHGYDYGHEVVFARKGEIYKTTIGLFFDKQVYGRIFLNPDKTCAHPVRASILAAIEEYSFYRQNQATCLIDSFDQKKTTLRSYSECKFERDQILAALKQFCPQEYFGGQMVGGLTFIGRPFVERVVSKNIPILGANNLYSRIARAAILEAAEEGVRTLYTVPPGSPTQQIMEEMIARGKLQGVIGVGFQISPLITLIGVAPMVVHSYQSLGRGKADEY